MVSTETEKSQTVKVSEDLYKYFETSEAYEVYPDFLEFAENKDDQIKWAVISNFDVRLHTILRELKVSKYFNLVITSEEATFSKSSKEIFELTLDKLKEDPEILPSEVLHIGDDAKNDCPPQGWHRILLQRDRPSGRFKNVCQSFHDVAKSIGN